MVAIPKHFYYEGKLYQKIAVIQSDSSILSFCYSEQDKFFLPLLDVRRRFKKAFTITQAANLIRISRQTLMSIFDRGLHDPPERVYDTNTLAPGRYYVNEEDMLAIRRIAYDLLPKNKYGVPYKDEMASEEELVHAMRLNDSRDYVVKEGRSVRIFRADDE